MLQLAKCEKVELVHVRFWRLLLNFTSHLKCMLRYISLLHFMLHFRFHWALQLNQQSSFPRNPFTALTRFQNLQPVCFRKICRLTCERVPLSDVIVGHNRNINRHESVYSQWFFHSKQSVAKVARDNHEKVNNHTRRALHFVTSRLFTPVFC